MNENDLSSQRVMDYAGLLGLVKLLHFTYPLLRYLFSSYFQCFEVLYFTLTVTLQLIRSRKLMVPYVSVRSRFANGRLSKPILQSRLVHLVQLFKK